MDLIEASEKSARITTLDSELKKALKELQDEVEDGKIFANADSAQNFSSLQIPSEVKYFRNERQLELQKYLQVDEAKRLVSHAEVMNNEIKSCLSYEYNKDSIPLLLHQFFVNHVQELLVCKQLHMLRWARFCEHTKAIEKVYPFYQQRMSNLIEEYDDSVARALRLSKVREACLTHSDIPTSIVKEEDLLIYTRWMICHFHSIKKIQSFLKIIKWVTQSHLQFENLSEMTSLGNTVTDIENKRIDNSLCDPSNINKKLLKTPLLKRAAWKNAFRKVSQSKRTRNESLPFHSNDLHGFSDKLDELLIHFNIDMQCSEIEDSSCEMDMFNLSLRKFKKLHFKQEQQRKFPVCEKKETSDSKIKKDDLKTTYKRESNWISFIQIKPEMNATQLSALTKLKEQKNVDELLLIYSKFLHVESNDTILYLLREHMKQVEEQQRLAAHQTPYYTNKSTKDIWKKIFDSSVKKKPAKGDFLEFDDNVLDNTEGGKGDFDITSSVEKLGLQDDNVKKHPIASNGSYMSFLVLRHLKIKEDRAKCLNILNYFRSVERTITINHVQLSCKENSTSDAKNTPTQSNLGNHQYLHNTPVDYVMNMSEFMKRSEVENHDDFYIYEDRHVYVQDQMGFQIMYDAALNDFRELEEEIILICSSFIQKDCWKKKHRVGHAYQNDVDLDTYSNINVDRFAVLNDIWDQLGEYLEQKKQLLDCYLESYHHVFNVMEKENMAKIISTLIYQKPRFDYEESYFVKALHMECKLVSSNIELIKSIINEHINDQRDYVQKLYRDDKQRFGFPLKVIPVQSVLFQTNKPLIHPVYMLEFHPSLSLMTQIPSVVKSSYMELLHMYQPFATIEKITLEFRLVEILKKLWHDKKVIGFNFSNQIRKDIFSDVFIEDPIFVCDLVKSLHPSSTTSRSSLRGSNASLKDDSKKMISNWSKLMEVITFRHRLIENSVECNILLKIYENSAIQMGLDECHAYMRPVSFDFAKEKLEGEKKPLTTKHLMEDESKLDRYIPSQAILSIMEVDEKHVSVFNFRHREGLLSLLHGDNIEKLRLSLLTQIVEKHLLITAVRTLDSCLNVIRSEVKRDEATISAVDLKKASLVNIARSSSTLLSLAPGVTKETILRDLIFKKLNECFLSLQAEKSFHRDHMLNQFLTIKVKKPLNTIDEMNKLKRECIQEYCLQLNQRVEQHAYKAQIISEVYSLKELVRSFPVTRDAHFMFGEEEKRCETNELQPVPGVLTRRPHKLLSDDGKVLLNLWYIPHYSEIFGWCYGRSDEECNIVLLNVLRLISALHEICEYLCAHARCGSSYARMGSQKLEYSGITADWGGTEGIGAELREIQKQISLLDDSSDPNQVAYYLERKRDVLFMEYKVAIAHSVKEAFLTSQNMDAYKQIDSFSNEVMSALSNKSNASTNTHQLELPNPLYVSDERSKKWFPWRHFINRFNGDVGRYWASYMIGYYLQLPLAGLKDVDRNIVHGEILGESLLIEDVIMEGKPPVNINHEKDTSRSNKRPATSSRPSSSLPVPSTESNSSNIKLSWSTDPLPTLEFVHEFLVLWCRLENLKHAWALLRMNVQSINTFKLFESFKHLYKQEVLQPVFNHLTDSTGQTDFKEFENLPVSVTDYELKMRQIARLIENITCLMINEVIRKVSRDHVFVINEKSRDEPNMPTDLWKTSSMKENINVQKPNIIENFVKDLALDENCTHTLTIDTKHFEKCLMKLGTSCMSREKQMFLNYATFFENLLRQQNHALFLKEEEVKDLKVTLENHNVGTGIEVDCGLAEKSYDLLVEITALRSKISQLTDENEKAEELVNAQLKERYNEIVLDLFNNSFGMKKRFEQFRISLYGEVTKSLIEVRKVAVENVKHVRVKYCGDASNISSQRLIQAERLREAQKENTALAVTISKLRCLSFWNRMKNNTKLRVKMDEFQDESSRAKKEYLEKNILHEEKETLLKEEQDALKILIKNLEKESDSLKKQLQKEQKLKAEQSHAMLQEVQSMKHLELAKASNVENLISQLEQKDKELESIKSSSGVFQVTPYQVPSQMKRILQQTMNQVEHERHLKLTAFERVDELQKQVHELELKVMSLIRKEKGVSHHDTCFPAFPGGRVSPQRQYTAQRCVPNAPTSPRRPLTSAKLRPKSGIATSRSRPKTAATKLHGMQSEISFDYKYLKKPF